MPAEASAEDLGGRAREALGLRAASVEAIEVLAQTPYAALPSAARERLGIGPAQKNVLLRLVIRDLERTLQLAAPVENPAAGWFLSISGLIFGALFMVIITIAFLLLFSRR